MTTPTSDDRSSSIAGVPSLKPHRYPLWLVAVTLLVAITTVYSATLAPPYVAANLAMEHARTALKKGERAEAERLFLEVLRAFPSSKSARIEIATLLLADPQEGQQLRGLNYLEGIKLDKYEWQRVSSVLPEQFRNGFKTIKK